MLFSEVGHTIIEPLLVTTWHWHTIWARAEKKQLCYWTDS